MVLVNVTTMANFMSQKHHNDLLGGEVGCVYQACVHKHKLIQAAAPKSRLPQINSSMGLYVMC